MPVLTDPQRLELLKLLQEQPQMSQRDLAQAMGVSLGKANYCLKALMERGLVKFGNFRKNPHKGQYAYLLTPAGLEEKTRIDRSARGRASNKPAPILPGIYNNLHHFPLLCTIHSLFLNARQLEGNRQACRC